MRKLLLYAALFSLVLTSDVNDVKAQNVLYRDTLGGSTQICPTGTYAYKWANYKNFRSKLDTTAKFFTEVRMWGEVAKNNSVSERVCKDQTEVRRLAHALKNGLGYVSVCNGYKWEVSAAGNCSAGSCSAPTSEIVHFATYPSSASTGVCACTGTDYWVIRTTIQNTNNGGVMVGTSGTTCNPASQWIELEFKSIPPFNYDIATVSTPTLDRCTPKQDITAKFANLGKKKIDSFQYTVSVNGTNYGPYWEKVNLLPEKDTSLVVLPAYSFSPNTAYNIKVWGSKPNGFKDSFAGDDTAYSKLAYQGQKPQPLAFDTAVCGSQSLTLRAKPGSSGDSLAWFANRQMSQFLGFGTKYQTQYLASGATYKFYVASYNGFSKGVINKGYTYTNYWPGNMFDVKALAADLFMDSMGVNLYSYVLSPGSSYDCEVWVRDGSYADPGASTNSSMWTRIYNGQVLSKGSQNRSVIPVKYTFLKNKSYGVYVFFSDGLLFDPGSGTTSNGDIQITTGTANQGNFGTVLTGYDWDGEIFYRYLLCPSTPDSAIVDVKPTPYGARLLPGTPFQTSPINSGSGTKSSPHVVAMGDTLAFDLRTPTGYTDANHNSTWKVANVSMYSPSGRMLTTYTWKDPNPKAGRLAYTPDTSVIDSVVRAVVRIQQIGGSNCDTFLTHYIYVAPLPVPQFSRKSKICDGDVIDFTNLSTIKSGYLDYKWYFGDGDSSDAVEPVKQYAAYGTYYCRLNARSSLYGYVRTKIDTIEITQIPLVSFKVQNACETQAHKFINATTVNSGSLIYSWNFGDNSSASNQKDPVHTYSTAGQYKVTLTASANGCSSSASKNAYLFPKPKANFTYPSNGIKYCTNTPVTFQNQSTISSGTVGAIWTFEGGEFGTVNAPTHTFDMPGAYNIKLIAISEFGCQDSMKKSLTVFEAPKVSFTHSPVCDLTPTDFTNTTPAVSGSTANYKWTFGDGGSSAAQNPTHQYTILGPKTVKLVVKQDNSCSDSASVNVNVATQADVDFDVANTCSGKEVQFENKTTYQQGNITYKWLFGGVDSSTVSDPRYTFNVNSSTTYNITLIAMVDGACESQLTKNMTVFELPKCDFTVTDDWTPGDGYRTIKVAANNTTYPFYRFKFSDGGSLNTASGTYQFPYDGEFTITMVARNQVDCECQSSQLKAIRNSLGTSEINKSDVRLFPNPSSGVVNVTVSESNQIKSIEVFNLLGENVNTSVKITNNAAAFDFGDAVNGIYLVKVTTATGVTTRRITLSR